MHPEKRKEWSVERGKLVQGKSRAKFYLGYAEPKPSFAFAQVRLRLSNVKIYFLLHSACTYFA